MNTIRKKLRRKLFGLLKMSVPFRTKYRPVGYYEPDEAAKKFEKQGSFYTCIYANYETKLAVPRSLFQKVAPYTIYDPFKLTDTESILSHSTNYEVLRIPNGRLYTNNVDCIAVITSDNKLVARLSYQYKVDAKVDTVNNKIFRQKYFIKPQFIKGTVFSLLCGYGPTNNIGHWFFDSIPRIHLLKESGLFNEVDYFVVPAYLYDYQIDSLKLLGISAEKIIAGKEDLHLIAKNLIASSHPRGERSFILPKWISEFLRTEYLKHVTTDSLSPKRVYISRKDSRLRRVTNEGELEVVLKKHGFQTIVNSKLSLLEKIRLFANAEVVVSTSGAGLAGLFFCQNGSSLIELFPEGFVHTHYYNIAIQNGMRYFSLICTNDNPSKNMKQGQLEDLYVDLSEIEKLLLQVEDDKHAVNVLEK
jgi:capsular polysaccharide biosynthesis protein